MKKVIGLLLPLAMIIIGIQFIRDHFGDTGEELKQKYEQLSNEGATTTAQLADQYKETTIKIAGIPIKLYEVEYTFSVLGDEFSGKKSLSGPPTQAQMEVTYLPSDPDINAIQPQEELSQMLERSKSNTSLYIGLALLLVGLFIGIGRVKAFQQPKKPETIPSNRSKQSTVIIPKSKVETPAQATSKTETKLKPVAASNTTIADLKNEAKVKKDFKPSDHNRFMPQ